MNGSVSGQPGPGIEAYVPLRQLPNGRAMLLAPPREELLGPPDVDGMPMMPAFPAGFLNGRVPMGAGGQTTAPVAPFNPVPLGVQMAERSRQQLYPGPPSLGALLPPIPMGPRATTLNDDGSGRPS
ncbi:MAG TPA: hypothetical protein VK191_14530 [Symbiobacteriaceae bacterium]|nr:hypothetical protein [Symbiobacteriaceae bacterium]